MPCIPNSAPSPTFAASSTLVPDTTWKSRSTSRCNARRTTLGSSSIPSGSATERTARFRHAGEPAEEIRGYRQSGFRLRRRIALWEALRDVFLFWVNQGVKIFRVDNPHTKPFPFWEWLIREIRARDPNVIFLAEAFTRPKVMKSLAKLGFSQSYTYFTWRTGQEEFCKPI